MEEIDLKELIDIFLRKKFLIILIVLMFGALGAIYTLKLIVPEYKSTTNLILVQIKTETTASADPNSNSITTTDVTLNSKLVQDYMEIIKSKKVLNRVINELKLKKDYEELHENVTVTSKADTELIEVSVRSKNPEQAAKIANKVADIFIDTVEELFNVKNVIVLDVAEVSEEPCNINLSKNILIFAFMGLIVVSAYILLVNMLDTTVSTDIDIEKALKIPVLASIALTEEYSNKKAKKEHTKKQNIKKIDIEAEYEAYREAGSFSYLDKNNYIKTDEDIEAMQKDQKIKE